MKQTLFPGIRLKEQIARYRAIYVILDGYREGRVTMKEVLAIPKDEVREARDWMTQVSFELLEADIPDFWDEDEP